MDLANVHISDHALFRFKQRWFRINRRRVHSPRMLLRKYLGQLTEVQKPTIRKPGKKRMSCRCRFFLYGCWLFVIDESLSTLITVIWLREKAIKELTVYSDG